jgi:4-amino-4-deoxy-L-arabinose transferase-like glycosyltransferase
MTPHGSKVHQRDVVATSVPPPVPMFGPLILTRSQMQVLAVVLIVTAAFAARSCALFMTSIDADEGVYLVMAQRWLQGGLPYVAVWDQHPPGVPALLAVVLGIISDPVLGARLAAAAAVSATAILIHRFCLRYAHNAAAGLIAALLYIICISRWAGLSANTEVFNNFCVTFAAYHLFGAARRAPDPLRAVMAASVLGVGLQIKYVVFPEAALLCLGYLFASYQRSRNLGSTAIAAGAMILAGCLPTALVLGYFWSKGALRSFLDANIGSNITYIGMVPSFVDIVRDSTSGMLPIVGPVLIILYAILRRVQWRPRQSAAPSLEAWILLWIVAAAVDVCLPMKFFRHYFFAFYPPVCLGGVLALYSFAAGRRKPFANGIVVLLATAVPLWVMGALRAAPWTGEDIPRTIAGIIREAGAVDGDLYVYRYQPTVYALARLRPPTPYVMTLELSEFSESAHVDGIKEVQRVMAGQPRFVIKPVEALGGQAGAVDDVLNRSLTHYRLVHTFIDNADRSVVHMYERSLPGVE